MKKLLISILTLLLTTNLMSQEQMTYEQSISYIIGYNIGRNMQQEPFAFDADAIGKGIKAAFSGEKPAFTEQEMAQKMQEWQMKMQAEQDAKASEASAENKGKGKAFLEDNKKNKDVVETASGLQYKVEKMGDGKKPASSSSTVTVHYEGKLLDGTVFDSSYERGETISFPLNQVIPGWTEGLQLMPVGSKFVFYIPSDLAYGDRAVSIIPAGSTLIFTVELFEVKD